MSCTCDTQAVLFKDQNLDPHYVTKQKDKYRNLSNEEHARVSDALLAKLQTQQGPFTKLNNPRNAAFRTSYAISHKLARKSKAFSDGEFIKECLLDSVSLSQRTVARRVEEIAEKLTEFDCFSLALNESCDVCETAQLLIFLRGIQDFETTEELAAMQSMKGTTTGQDSFTEVNGCLDKLGLK